MKNTITLFFTLIVFAGFINAQVNTRTLTWDDTERQYIEYVSAIYDAEVPAQVIICLHGLGDDMNNFYNIGFNEIVDTANGIVIVPQALDAVVPLLGSVGNCWNAGVGAVVPMLGEVILNQDVDDTGFLTAILDSLENNYNIDTERVYFVGFSLGGFMCNRMASEISDRVTAIASVSGTYGLYYTPEPFENINVLHIHGTADETIGYDEGMMVIEGYGEIDAGMGAQELVDYWVDYNNCSESPIYYQYPDAENDGLTFERFIYMDGDSESTVAHIKVNEGTHTWYYTPVNDVDYRNEIWRFFKNQFLFSTENESIVANQDLNIYPNPAKDFVYFTSNESISKIEVYNLVGSKVISKKINTNQVRLNLSELNAGLYIVRIFNGNKVTDRKLTVK